jgi:hypothetical protein
MLPNLCPHLGVVRLGNCLDAVFELLHASFHLVVMGKQIVEDIAVCDELRISALAVTTRTPSPSPGAVTWPSLRPQVAADHRQEDQAHYTPSNSRLRTHGIAPITASG